MEKKQMELVELGNRINALSKDNASVAEFKTILSGLKEIGEDKEAKAKAILDLETKVQQLVEKAQSTVVTKEKSSIEIAGDMYQGLLNNKKYKSDAAVKQILAAGGRQSKDSGLSDWHVDEKSALGSYELRGDATTGSYVVPQGMYGDIMYIAKQASQLMGKVTTIPMANASMLIPSLNSSYYPAFSWPANQAAAKSETEVRFGTGTLTAKTAACWVSFTDEINEDSVVPLAQFFNKLIGEAWGQEFDKQCLTASAAPFTGVMAAGASGVVTGTRGDITEVTYADLLGLQSAIPTNALTGAAYIMSPSVFATLRAEKVAQSYVVSPVGPIPGSIGGYPVILSDVMPAVGVASSQFDTPFIVFGNPKNILVGERVGLDIKLFDQTVYAMNQDQLFLRARIRAAFLVPIPTAFSMLKTFTS